MEKIIFNGGQRHTYQDGEPVETYERVPYDTAEVITTEPPLEFHPKFANQGKLIAHDVTEFMAAHQDDMPIASHMAYESGRLKDFLPTLYNLWKDLPDPWENVHYDLTTERQPDGTWKHKYDNKPHKNRNV